MNSKEFSLTIEGIVKEKKISHMDAVIWYCEQNGLDPSQVSSVIYLLWSFNLSYSLSGIVTVDCSFS